VRAPLLPHTELSEGDDLLIIEHPDPVVSDQGATGLPRPEREVLVFCAGVRKRLVEATYLPEQLATDGQVAGRQKRGGVTILSEPGAIGIRFKTLRELQPVAAKGRPFEGRAKFCGKIEYTGHERIVVSAPSLEVQAQMRGLDQHVVITEQQQLAVGDSRARVSCGGGPSPLPQRKLQPDAPLLPRSDDLCGRVVSSQIIDDHHLVALRWKVECKQGVESTSQGVRTTIGRHDDGHSFETAGVGVDHVGRTGCWVKA